MSNAKGKSIVLSNSNDKNVQLIVNAINNELSNYDKTILTNQPTYLKQGNSQAVDNLLSDMKDGKVSALITYNVNPSYSYNKSKQFNEWMAEK